MEDFQEDRRLGQSPLTPRTKSEVRRGDPGAASSSTAMPAFILEENPTAAADFNDKFSAIADGPEGFVSTFFQALSSPLL